MLFLRLGKIRDVKLAALVQQEKEVRHLNLLKAMKS